MLNSGCTSHIAKNPHIFTQLDTAVKILVIIGNGAIILLANRGIMAIQTNQGTKHTRFKPKPA